MGEAKGKKIHQVPWKCLTPRQREVYMLAVNGLLRPEISRYGQGWRYVSVSEPSKTGKGPRDITSTLMALCRAGYLKVYLDKKKEVPSLMRADAYMWMRGWS